MDAAGDTFDNERRRIAIDALDLGALRGLSALDHITDFAARLCDAPVALVSLVEEEEQIFLARTGFDQTSTPRSESFCAHAMLGSGPMIVSDAAVDPRFADNPLVTSRGVRFYAGLPLVTDQGVPLGALCVLDFVPRHGLTPLQRDGLSVLAENVMARLHDSRDRSAHRAAERHARHAARDSDQRFRILADTMPQMVWSTLPDGYHDYYNARWYEFTGVPDGSTDGEAWNGMFHPDDQERAWAVWRHCLATGDPYEIEYRLRHRDGTYRWVLGRALPIRDAGGAIERWFGTCTDIHEQKLALEEREVISQELSHRIKNIFSVVAGLIQFAARNNPAFAGIATDLRQRIMALGRAHDFVRPHSPQSRPHVRQDSLHGLLEELFAPYQSQPGERITITGPDVPIDDRAATPIALLFHELATNASKYGALSRDAGRIILAIAREGDDVVLRWRELGAPMLAQAPDNIGFGTQLVEMSAVRQLGGSIARVWEADGLALTCIAPVAAFSRSPGS